MSLETGDPSWRTKGNSWLGRRILYTPTPTEQAIAASAFESKITSDITNKGTFPFRACRACDYEKKGKRVNFAHDASCPRSKQYKKNANAKNASSASQSNATPKLSFSGPIKGTILGFIHEKDKDSKGMSGFLSSIDAKPAKLFHVVFDKHNEYGLLNKDFEEWEVKEKSEWIDDDEDDDSDDDDGLQSEGGAKDAFEFVDKKEAVSIEKNHEEHASTNKRRRRKKITPNAKDVSEALGSRNKVTFSQDPVESVSVNEVTGDISESKQPKQKFHAERTKVIGNNESSSEDGTAAAEDATSLPVESSTKAPRVSPQESTKSIFSESSGEATIKVGFPPTSSFNEALKAVLSTYSSNSALKSSNNPPQPVPPPFLSHQEESTLRTALAFAMIKARKRNNNYAKSTSAVSQNATATSGLGRNGWTRPWSNSSSIGKTSFGPGAVGRIGGMRSPLNQYNATQVTPSRPVSQSYLLGGLLSLPRQQSSIGHVTNTAKKTTLVFEREMNHVRDILKLAVSSILPLYKGALEKANNTITEGSSVSSSVDGRNDGGRVPCAVYDYETASQPSFDLNADSENNVAERHCVTLDGLCQHAISRIASLIQDSALKAATRKRAIRSVFDQGTSDAGGNESNSINHHDTVRETIIRLLYDDLVGSAYSKGTLDLDVSMMYDDPMSPSLTRTFEEQRIEKIMTASHILHRLVFLDKSCCFGTESVIAITRMLTDLYNNTSFGQSDRIEDGANCRSMNDEVSKSSSTIRHDDRSVIGKKGDREKRQVVQSRWSSSSSAYSMIRHERRDRAIDFIAQGFATGSKRMRHPETEPALEKSTSLPLPDVGDVLAVNLIRLLECAAAIRLHHRQQRISPDHMEDRDFVVAKIESVAAAEILTEIRSTAAMDLTMPLHMNDVATVYYHETTVMRARNMNSDITPAILRPCAKIMLRVHFYDLMKKLIMYEQA